MNWEELLKSGDPEIVFFLKKTDYIKCKIFYLTLKKDTLGTQCQYIKTGLKNKVQMIDICVNNRQSSILN